MAVERSESTSQETPAENKTGNSSSSNTPTQAPNQNMALVVAGVVLVVLVAIGATFFLLNSSDDNGDENTFENDLFSAKYPENWDVEENAGQVTFNSPDAQDVNDGDDFGPDDFEGLEVVGVIIQTEEGENEELASLIEDGDCDIFSQGFGELGSSFGFGEQVESRTEEVAGRNACVTTVDLTQQDVIILTENYFFFDNDTSFIVSIASTGEKGDELERAREIVESLELK